MTLLIHWWSTGDPELGCTAPNFDDLGILGARDGDWEFSELQYCTVLQIESEAAAIKLIKTHYPDALDITCESVNSDFKLTDRYPQFIPQAVEADKMIVVTLHWDAYESDLLGLATNDEQARKIVATYLGKKPEEIEGWYQPNPDRSDVWRCDYEGREYSYYTADVNTPLKTL